MFFVKFLLLTLFIKTVVTTRFFKNYHVNVFSKMSPAKLKCFGFGIGYNSRHDCEEFKNEMNNAINVGFGGIFGKHKFYWKQPTMRPMTTHPDEDYVMDMEMDPGMAINTGMGTSSGMGTNTVMGMEMQTTPSLTYTNTVPEEETDVSFSPKITEECGKTMLPPSSRVVGGHQAQEMEYPWQVGIQRLDTDVDDKEVFLIRGGGAILNNRWILTAAHVFNDVTLNETRGIYGTISSVNPRKTIKFDKLIIHPNYDMKTFMNDIALLRVDKDMELFPNQTTVNSICLPEKYKTYGGMATVTGWGVTESNIHAESPEFLMSVGLKIINDQLCTKLYPTYNASVMICAGEPDGGKDSCDGDSGGPLLVYRNQRGVVVGIVSFGQPRSCGKKDTAAVYTKVTKFVDWIIATVNSES